MRTEDLVEQLAGSVTAVPRNAAARRLFVGMACGALASLVVLVAWLGVRPDFVQASGTLPFWMKWAFTLALAWSSFVIVQRLARPDGRVGRAWWGLAAPIAIVGMMGLVEMIRAPSYLREDLWLGSTAAQCPVAIVALAAPVFWGLLWAFRRLAPTRLSLAGAAAGVLAGATGASVYALTCPEHTAAFMAAWYSAGILAAGLIGALLGPRLLRW